MSPELQKNLKKTLNVVQELYRKSDKLNQDLEMDEDTWNEYSIEIGSTIGGYVDAIATMCGIPEDNSADYFSVGDEEWPEGLWCRDRYEDYIYRHCHGEGTFEQVVEMITSMQELAKDFTPREKLTV